MSPFVKVTDRHQGDRVIYLNIGQIVRIHESGFHPDDDDVAKKYPEPRTPALYIKTTLHQIHHAHRDMKYIVTTDTGEMAIIKAIVGMPWAATA